MKAIKALTKSFETPQRKLKFKLIKIQVNFYFNTTFENAWSRKG